MCKRIKSQVKINGTIIVSLLLTLTACTLPAASSYQQHPIHKRITENHYRKLEESRKRLTSIPRDNDASYYYRYRTAPQQDNRIIYYPPQVTPHSNQAYAPNIQKNTTNIIPRNKPAPPQTYNTPGQTVIVIPSNNNTPRPPIDNDSNYVPAPAYNAPRIDNPPIIVIPREPEPLYPYDNDSDYYMGQDLKRSNSRATQNTTTSKEEKILNFFSDSN